MRLLCCLMAAAALSGCTRVRAGDHLAASDYTGSLHRVLVVNQLDSSFDKQLPDSFGTAMDAALRQCGVATLIYRPNAMELDAEAKLKAQMDGFRADGALVIRQTVRNTRDGDVRGGSYLVTARDLGQKRDVWKAMIGMGSSASFLTDRSKVGAVVADKVIRQMAADGAIKTCPPFPPEPSN